VLTKPSLETLFWFETKVIGKEGSDFKINQPTRVNINLERRSTRYKLLTPNAIDVATIYIPEQEQKFNIVDISTGGLQFNTLQAIFECTQVLKKTVITIPELPSLKLVVDIQIKHQRKMLNNKYAYGACFLDIDFDAFNILAEFIFERCHKGLLIEDEILEKKHNDDAGQVAATWLSCNSSLLQRDSRASSIFAEVLNASDGSMLNFGLSLRMYNDTFLCLSSFSFIREDTLKTQSVDKIEFDNIALGHPHFKYYLSYTDQKLQAAQTFINLRQLMDEPNRLYTQRLLELKFNVSQIQSDIGHNYEYTVKLLDDPSSFIHYCKNSITTLQIECFDYKYELFYLPGISAFYEPAGIHVVRQVWETKDKKNNILAYVVAEVGLMQIGDVCRVYYNLNDQITGKKDDTVNAICLSVLPELAKFYKAHGKNEFKLYIADEKQQLNVKGLKRKTDVLEVIMDIKGLLLLKKLMLSSHQRV